MHRFLFGLACLAATGFVAQAQSYSISTVAGKANYHGDIDGPGAQARFTAVRLAFDSAGNAYFGDTGTHTVRKLAPDGTISTVAGASGVTGSSDGAAAAARFNRPGAVAMDASGNLYVADAGNFTVRKLSVTGTVSTVAGQIGVTGSADGVGAAAQFGAIIACAFVPSGDLLVAETSLSGDRIRRVTPAGEVTTLYANADGKLGAKAGLQDFAVDTSGNIYLANLSGFVRKIAADGTAVTLAGASGIEKTIDGTGSAASFQYPLCITVASNGDLWVADLYAIRKVTAAGVVTTVLGQPDDPNRTSDGMGGAARLNAPPQALATDHNGNLWLADAYGTVLRKIVHVAADSPPILTRAPVLDDWVHNIGAGQKLDLVAAAAGTPPFQYQWYKDAAAIPGGTNAMYTIASASASDQGGYKVTVANPAGTYTSRTTSVRVFTPAFSAFTPRHAIPGGSFLWAIATGPATLVAVGTGGKILTSTNGQTWNAQNSGTSEWLVGVTYGAGQFVAVGDHGTVLLSADGTSWTRAASSGTVARLNNVAYANGQYVAVGEGGTIVTSPDAQSWMPQLSGVTTWLRGLVYMPRIDDEPFVSGDNGTGRFYVSGQNGVVLELLNGTWQVPQVYPRLDVRADVEALTVGPTGAIGVGQDGQIAEFTYRVNYGKLGAMYNGRIHYNGMEFAFGSTSNIGLMARFRGLATGAGAIFATGENGVIAAGQSAQGPWSFIPSGTTANLVGGVFFGNTMFVVGADETILQSQPLYVSRLINISTRGEVGTGADVLISGFVIRGSEPKTMLLRAAGPALSRWVSGTLAAPLLTVYDATNQPIASNHGWSGGTDASAIAAATTAVGAFPFPAGSTDAAILVTLAPGSYTATVRGADGGTGMALVEAYDTERLGAEGSRAVNIATRGRVGAADQQLIAGFVINGSASRRVLIRAVGPGLAQFGLDGVLAEPQVTVYNAGNQPVGAGAAWEQQPNHDEIITATSLAGTFALDAGSKDAAIVVTLPPGNYTAQVSGTNGGTGIALIEVYDLP